MIHCEISFEFPDLADLLERNLESLQLFIAGQLQYNRAMIFENEGAYNGHPRWKELAFRNGMILSNRGILRKSLAPVRSPNEGAKTGANGILEVTRTTVMIGTTLGYARMMNDGTTKMPDGVLRPVKAKALKIPVPQGKNAGPAAQALHKKSIEQKISAATDKMRKQKPGSKAHESSLTRISKMKMKAKNATSGEKFIFRKSVRIPARDFETLNVQDEREISEALANKIQQLMERGE